MAAYYVWKKNGKQLELIEQHEDKAAANEKAELYNRHRFYLASPIKYVVTGPHESNVTPD